MFKILILLFLLLLFTGVVDRKIFRVLIIAGLALLLVRELQHFNTGCCPFSSCARSVWSSGSFTVSDEHKKAINVVPGATLELRSLFGRKISVKGWDKPFVQVSFKKHAVNEDDLKKVHVDISPDTDSKARRVEISDSSEGSGWIKKGRFSSSWSSSSGTSPCIDYELFVPNNLLKSISLNGRSGAIAVDSLTVQELEFNTSSGAISAKNINGNVDMKSRSGCTEVSGVSGNLKIDSQSGVINIENVKKDVVVRGRSGFLSVADVGGSVDVDTKSGAVNMRYIDGDLRVETHSGAIMLTDVAGAIDVSAKSGAVNISRSADAQGSIKASSRSGYVVVKDHAGSVIAEGRGQIILK